jgi:hypothetical protein
MRMNACLRICLLLCVTLLVLLRAAGRTNDKIGAKMGSLPIQDVKCFSQEGNIDHYYHFFLNCLLPVVVFHQQNLNKRLRLCSSPVGDMIHIFRDVLPHMKYNRDCDRRNTVYLKGFDDSYGRGVKRITPLLRDTFIRHFLNLPLPVNRTASNTNSTNATAEISAAAVLSPTDILLIGRAAPTPDSRRLGIDPAETSGAQRRAIHNFAELDAALRRKFSSVNTVYLEGLPVRKQFWLFRNSKVIIAQHGAGLSNIFFASNSTKGVIEINPYNSRKRIGKYTYSFPDCFKYMCENVGLKYVRIAQTGEFSDVNIGNVVTAASRLMNGP